jgi:hypothetical protein
MNQETIKEQLKKQPFVPFKVVLSTGEAFEIRHPEFVIVTKFGMIVAYPDSPRLSICSLLHIANIETATAAQAV